MLGTFGQCYAPMDDVGDQFDIRAMQF